MHSGLKGALDQWFLEDQYRLGLDTLETLGEIVIT